MQRPQTMDAAIIMPGEISRLMASHAPSPRIRLCMKTRLNLVAETRKAARSAASPCQPMAAARCWLQRWRNWPTMPMAWSTSALRKVVRAWLLAEMWALVARSRIGLVARSLAKASPPETTHAITTRIP